MDEKTLLLIHRAIQQEPDAFDELYKMYEKKVYYIALRLTNCDADAQDASQETFIQVKKSLTRLKDPALFEFWLHKIVLSKCKRIFRKNRYMPTDPQDYAHQNTNVEQRDYMIPHEYQKKENEKELLLKLIDRLPYRQKEVLLLAYFEQYKYKEIADLLEISENTVKSRIYLAKQTLRQEVEEYERKEAHKCSFHASTLELAITSAYMAGFGSVIHHVTLAGFITKSISFLKEHIAMSSIIAVSTTCTLVGIVSSQSAVLESPRQELFISTFTPVMYKGEQLHTEREAFYTLVMWANTKESMMEKSTAEVEEIVNVYEALKQAGGPYFDLLIRKGWKDELEIVIPSIK